MTDDFDADIVVIGAGFAGLGAARALQRAGKSVVVVEATGLGEEVGSHLRVGRDGGAGGDVLGGGGGAKGCRDKREGELHLIACGYMNTTRAKRSVR